MTNSTPAHREMTNEPPGSDPSSITLRPPKRTSRWLPFSVVVSLILLAAAAKVAYDWSFYLGLSSKDRVDVQAATVGHYVLKKPAPAFDFSHLAVPKDRIFKGGPGKDGIPALTNPAMLAPTDAGYLNPDDRVIGVNFGSDARAYPLRILNWHEVVNDTVGRIPVAVTYCPLCDSVALFDRRTDSGAREFGVSGRLYNSNVLMYERGGKPLESLWSQLMARAISGEPSGQGLKTLPVEFTTWQDWLARHPETRVLSDETGYPRDYQSSAYGSYFGDSKLYFPVSPRDRRLGVKAKLLGVWVEGAARAYPLSALAAFDQPFEDELAGRKFTLHYNHDAKSVRVASADDGVQWMYAFWFAWYAFHPDTEVFSR